LQRSRWVGLYQRPNPRLIRDSQNIQTSSGSPALTSDFRHSAETDAQALEIDAERVRPKNAQMRLFLFTDPIPYQAAIRGVELDLLVTARGSFHAELTQIDLDRLLMQYGSETLPRVSHALVSSERVPIMFLADSNRAAVHYDGNELSSAAIVVNGGATTHHLRTYGPCCWATISLPSDEWELRLSAAN
jgi:hypothetical protein